MHKILAGILHLGNVDIIMDENDFSSIKENEAILASSVSSLTQCLITTDKATMKMMLLKGGGEA